MNFTISPMTEADVEEVAAIEKRIFSLPWSKQAFSDSLRLENTIYLTIRAEGKVAGYCGMYQSFSEGEIVNVAVDEKYRRQQAGRTLLQALLLEGEKRGVTTFLLEVRESNQAAIHLYESLGFTKAGMRKNFYEFPTEHAVIMLKENFDCK